MHPYVLAAARTQLSVYTQIGKSSNLPLSQLRVIAGEQLRRGLLDLRDCD